MIDLREGGKEKVKFFVESLNPGLLADIGTFLIYDVPTKEFSFPPSREQKTRPTDWACSAGRKNCQSSRFCKYPR